MRLPLELRTQIWNLCIVVDQQTIFCYNSNSFHLPPECEFDVDAFNSDRDQKCQALPKRHLHGDSDACNAFVQMQQDNDCELFEEFESRMSRREYEPGLMRLARQHRNTQLYDEAAAVFYRNSIFTILVDPFYFTVIATFLRSLPPLVIQHRMIRRLHLIMEDSTQEFYHLLDWMQLKESHLAPDCEIVLRGVLPTLENFSDLCRIIDRLRSNGVSWTVVTKTQRDGEKLFAGNLPASGGDRTTARELNRCSIFRTVFWDHVVRREQDLTIDDEGLYL